MKRDTPTPEVKRLLVAAVKLSARVDFEGPMSIQPLVDEVDEAIIGVVGSLEAAWELEEK
jgi:hypothetical protein